MSILSRTADNRRAFDLALILTKLISLIKIVLIEYKTPFIMDLKEDETNDVEQLFAQLILGYSFQIMFNFITYYHFWHPLRFIYNSNDRLHEIDNEIISDSKAELLKQGLLNIMKGAGSHFLLLLFLLLLPCSFWVILEIGLIRNWGTGTFFYSMKGGAMGIFTRKSFNQILILFIGFIFSSQSPSVLSTK